ncbi:MAG: hypothetical protein ABR583_08770 [Gaiellaceae bacterium]
MNRTRALLLLVLGLAAAAVAAAATYAAYVATTQNNRNSVAAGSVALSDNDSGTAMFTTLGSAKPGDTETSCIKVRYDGTLASSVRLYATVTGGLAPYLTLTVTRGSDPSPAFDNCATFANDATDYIGAGPGVVYSRTLSGFPTTYATAIVDPAVGGGTESWVATEEHVYKIQATLGASTAAQGQTSTAAFTWEARNQ